VPQQLFRLDLFKSSKGAGKGWSRKDK